MSKLDLIKGGVGLMVSTGVGAIVANLIKHTTPASTGKLMKICIFAGSVALTGIASLKAEDFITDQIDQAVKTVKEIF